MKVSELIYNKIDNENDIIESFEKSDVEIQDLRINLCNNKIRLFTNLTSDK